MDPITQGLIGGVAAQAIGKGENVRRMSCAGIIGGLVPDLDILIRSASDPLLGLQYHRHFTHSLVFIPLGGLLMGTLVWLLTGRRSQFGWVYLGATVGVATHGLLDALTSYGTLLFWPFSSYRVALDCISIIDPVVTLCLFLSLFWAFLTKRARPARVGLVCLFLYFFIGWQQRDRVLSFQQIIAQKRGHVVERGRALPTLGNLILWRSIYESEGRFYVDAVRAMPFKKKQFWAGGYAPKFQPADIGVPANSVLQQDVNRYSWFADQFLVRLPKKRLVVGDLRYALLPHGLELIWGIRINASAPQEHVQKVYFRDRQRKWVKLFLRMLIGQEHPSAEE